MKKEIQCYMLILFSLVFAFSGCVGQQNEERTSLLLPVYTGQAGNTEEYGENEQKEGNAVVPSEEKWNEEHDEVTPPLVTKADIAFWIDNNYTSYFQQYNLSCEPALIRMICGIWGIHDISEDEIMEFIPKHPINPELGFVMEDIHGDVYDADGLPYWSNYGAHAPVVLETLRQILRNSNLGEVYRVEMVNLTDKELRTFFKDEEDCLGAIIWVAAYIDDKKPPKNDIGQVLGEHVQFVSPQLDSRGRMLVYDVWPWENQPFYLFKPFNRDMFDYQTIVIMKNSDDNNQ